MIRKNFPSSFRTFLPNNPFPSEKISKIVVQESKLLGGVENQVRLLQNELSLINGFHKYTEAKRRDNELVKQVVCQDRDEAYRADNVIDTFIITVTKHRRRDTRCNSSIPSHNFDFLIFHFLFLLIFFLIFF